MSLVVTVTVGETRLGVLRKGPPFRFVSCCLLVFFNLFLHLPLTPSLPSTLDGGKDEPLMKISNNMEVCKLARGGLPWPFWSFSRDEQFLAGRSTFQPFFSVYTSVWLTLCEIIHFRLYRNGMDTITLVLELKVPMSFGHLSMT